MNRAAEWASAAAVAAALIYGYQWYTKPADVPAGMTVVAKPAPEVAEEPKVGIVTKAPIKVYKPGVKVRLKLPDAAIWDKDTHVIASSKTGGDDRPHTITTTINSATGETATYDRADPLPWFAVNTKSEIGLYAGYKNGEQALRIEARQELFQVKAVHFGAIASADMMRGGMDSFVGAGAWVRW